MFNLWKWSFGEKYIAFNKVLWKLLRFKMNFVISQDERLSHPLQNTQLQELFNTCFELFEQKSDSLHILASLSMNVNKSFVLGLRSLPNKTVVKTNKGRDCQRYEPLLPIALTNLCVRLSVWLLLEVPFIGVGKEEPAEQIGKGDD